LLLYYDAGTRRIAMLLLLPLILAPELTWRTEPLTILASISSASVSLIILFLTFLFGLVAVPSFLRSAVERQTGKVRHLRGIISRMRLWLKIFRFPQG